ncbi:peptide ABC transporter substrate-binding protein [Candidatus Sumerlaeota bacterium]|nr:peptide ABC transporter substrate-binding protein [Candidatus Sumerlaeota bacterium]
MKIAAAMFQFNPRPDCVFRPALIAIAALTLLAGCGEGSRENAGVGEIPGVAAGGKGRGLDLENRILRKNFYDEPKSMDPQKADDTIALMLLSHAFEGLTRLDPQDQPFPAQAESWEVKSPTHYIFKLREGILWSDGKPVTAKDFEFAWRRAVDPVTASTYAFIMNPIKNARAINEGTLPVEELGVKAIDDRTLEVTLQSPTAYFLRLLSFGTFYPAREDFVRLQGDSYGADHDKLLYNGPFVIAEWKHNSSIRLVKNKKYWNAEQIWFNEIDFPYLIRDENTIFNMFKDGQYAMIRQLSKELLPDALNNNLQIKKYNTGAVWYLQFNTTRRITGNKNFRKAVQYALNRQEYCSQVNGIPGTKPIFGIIPEYMPGVKGRYGDEYPLSFQDGDLATARKYMQAALDELGIEKIPPLTILASDVDVTKRDMEYFQQYFKETLGLELILDFQTFKVRLERTDNKDFDIVNSGWGPDYLDAMTFADLLTSWNGNNNTGWSSEEYDDKIRRAMEMHDPKARLDLMSAAEKILVEEAPIAPYFQQYRIYVQDPRLVGVLRRTISPDPDFYFARIVDTSQSN